MLSKGLNHCFSRFKRPSHSTPPPIPHSLNAPPASATSSSSVVFKSFNSLYDPAAAASDSEILTLTLSSSSSSAAAAAAGGSSFCSTSDSAAGTATAAEGSCPSDRDLSTAIASRRFFPASPGPSNSIVDSAAVAVGVLGAGVAVPTYSPDPYWEFRRSMEEMVAALGLDLRAHAAHLHELLLCYLSLNRKHAHKYIVGAFADLIVGLAAAESRRTDA
ncbi:transcription repressor OFP12-like [Phoenix dactylifera]|uniref:Transcription repressor n=1 Tax=Phoenix dactylifera TaxID=42345 RepID=A0A8B8JCX3_PHODC|nr:transcription repressor OFP12-like [Phoenix dactylifera]